LKIAKGLDLNPDAYNPNITNFTVTVLTTVLASTHTYIQCVSKNVTLFVF